jgi:hypothetical protein
MKQVDYRSPGGAGSMHSPSLAHRSSPNIDDSAEMIQRLENRLRLAGGMMK